MLIKTGVDISRLNRPIRRALNPISQWFQAYNEELVIISTYEGDHSPSSLHYCNDAIDVRFPRQQNKDLFKNLARELGKKFDVVVESDHIHIEYDPK
ncbi:hypothetical protein ES703_17928 [subsurface metagenome]